MKQQRVALSYWGLAAMTASLGIANLSQGANDELATAETAVQKADQTETKSYEKWDSHEMARSATREIARSERKRAEQALASFRAAQEAAKGGGAEAQKRIQERLENLRAAVAQMIEDSTAGDKAAAELIVDEHRHRSVMEAARTAQRELLESKAKAAEKAGGKEADAARRAVHECDAFKLYESQQWTRIHRGTGSQIVEMTGDAGRIATAIAEVEPDPERKKALLEFAAGQAKIKAEAEKLIAREDAEFAGYAAQIYPLRAAGMGGLKPLAPEKFDYIKARHLLVRAGFGGTPQEVEKLVKMGLYGAVDHLVEFYRHPAGAAFDAAPPVEVDPFEGKLKNRFMSGQVSGARTGLDSGQLARLRQWWLKRAVESQRPLQEKLALFWHGHFASQNSVVANSYVIYRQNQLFREHAAGNFGALLYGIVHDPAMLRYLDNDKNVKGDPNENLAREIMELFAMGRDQGYTEKDIIEGARALTGYTYDDHTGGFRFAYDKHDTTDKIIFGKKGPWSGDDFVRLILEQPATARFISKKLFEHFAHLDPAESTVDRLASVLRARNYEIEPLLKNIFLSEEFYGERSMGVQIKSPVQLVVGALRDLGVTGITSYASLDGAIQQMGQQLFEPPDVKGWRYGRSWISSNRLFSRYNSVADLIKSVPKADRSAGVDVVALLQGGGCPTGCEAVDYLARACLMRPLTDAKRKELAEYLGEMPPADQWTKQRAQLNEKLRGLMVLMLSTPEYQLM